MKTITLSNNEVKRLKKIYRKHQKAFDEEYQKMMNKFIMSRELGLKK